MDNVNFDYDFQFKLISIGKNIQDMRKRRGWSIKDLSEKSELETNIIESIEVVQREPKLIELHKLADGFGYPFIEAVCAFLEGESNK